MAGTPTVICSLAAPALQMRCRTLGGDSRVPTSEAKPASMAAHNNQRFQV